MNRNILDGRLALVTGASSGLGVDFARRLAELGCHLVLVARREERLRAVQQEICARYGIEVAVLPLDLTGPEAPQQLYDQLQHWNKKVDVLVNNAGFGIHGDFIDIPWEEEEQLLELNIISLAHLTKLFVKDMVAQDFGYILQVASIGAFQGVPTYASYAAAKGFILLFGEALNYELRRSQVSCTVLCPGITATEFMKVAGQRPTLYHRLVTMPSQEVARIGLDGMLRRKATVVPGWFNRLTVWGSRLVPRRLAIAVSYRLMTMR